VYVVSPTQVNLLAPAGAPPGGYIIRLETQSRRFAAVAALDTVAPALFSANASAQGVAAAYITLVSRDGSQRNVFTFTCGAAPGSCVAAPVRVDWANESAYLVLYGAGLRGRSDLSAVQAFIAGRAAEVHYAGAQPTCVGLDQVNLKLPSTLAGLTPELEVRLTVQGKKANVVTIRLN